MKIGRNISINNKKSDKKASINHNDKNEKSILSEKIRADHADNIYE